MSDIRHLIPKRNFMKQVQNNALGSMWLMGQIKAVHNNETNQSPYIVVETRAPVFDPVRQFVQQDINWYRVIVTSQQLQYILQFDYRQFRTFVSGALNCETPSANNYTAHMPTLIADKIIFYDLFSVDECKLFAGSKSAAPKQKALFH